MECQEKDVFPSKPLPRLLGQWSLYTAEKVYLAAHKDDVWKLNGKSISFSDVHSLFLFRKATRSHAAATRGLRAPSWNATESRRKRNSGASRSRPWLSNIWRNRAQATERTTRRNRLQLWSWEDFSNCSDRGRDFPTSDTSIRNIRRRALFQGFSNERDEADACCPYFWDMFQSIRDNTEHGHVTASPSNRGFLGNERSPVVRWNYFPALLVTVAVSNNNNNNSYNNKALATKSKEADHLTSVENKMDPPHVGSRVQRPKTEQLRFLPRELSASRRLFPSAAVYRQRGLTTKSPRAEI